MEYCGSKYDKRCVRPIHKTIKHCLGKLKKALNDGEVDFVHWSEN